MKILGRHTFLLNRAFFIHNRKLTFMGRVCLKVVPLYGQLPKPVVRTQYIPYCPGTFRCRGPQNTHYYLQRARRLDVPMRGRVVFWNMM